MNREVNRSRTSLTTSQLGGQADSLEDEWEPINPGRGCYKRSKAKDRETSGQSGGTAALTSSSGRLLQFAQFVNEWASRTISVRAFVQRVHYNVYCSITRTDGLQSAEDLEAEDWKVEDLGNEYSVF